MYLLSWNLIDREINLSPIKLFPLYKIQCAWSWSYWECWLAQFRWNTIIYFLIWTLKPGSWDEDLTTFFSAARLRAVPHFSSGIVERAKCKSAWKSPHVRKGDTRGVIFTRASSVSHVLLSLRKNGGLLVVYSAAERNWFRYIYYGL